MNENRDFRGAKIALYYEDEILIYLRDDKPEIPYPNKWDFFGGGREDGETVFECIEREVYEELGIHITRDQITYSKLVPSDFSKTAVTYFMVGTLTDQNIEDLDFWERGPEMYVRVS